MSLLSETYNASEGEINNVVVEAKSISHFIQLLYETSGDDSKIYGKEIEEITYVISCIAQEYPETSFEEIPDTYTDEIPEEIVPKFEDLWYLHITEEDDNIIEP